MKFSGIVQVWRFASERKHISAYFDEVKFMGICSRGPSVIYTPQYPFDCFQISVKLREEQKINFDVGYIVHVDGYISSANSRQYGTPGERWLMFLNTSADDVKVIGKSDIHYDPVEHIKLAGSNSKSAD